MVDNTIIYASNPFFVVEGINESFYNNHFWVKIFLPNMSCGSCVTSFNMHLGRPHVVLCTTIIFLSSFKWWAMSMGQHRSYRQC